MVVFETDSRQTMVSGIAALVVAGAVLVSSLVLAIALPKSLLTFGLILLALGMAAFVAWAAYHTYALKHTSYAVDRNSFVIRWGPIREIIPMGDVQRVIAGSDIAHDLRLVRLPLPGWWIGRGSHPALGKIHFFGTAPLDKQIILVTLSAAYAVSPDDTEAFVDAFRVRFQMGPTQAVRAARLYPPALDWPIWKSPVTLALIAVPILLNLIAFGLSFAAFPGLSDQIVLHFDAAGAADRFGGPIQVFGPALIGLVLLLVNFAIGLISYPRDRLAAYLAWGGSSGVQLLFLIATVTTAFTRS